MVGFFFLLSCLIFTSYFLRPAFAHPGGLDSQGGHTCRTNCAQYGLQDGEYHYHTTNSTPSPSPSPVSEATTTPQPTSSSTTTTSSTTSSGQVILNEVLANPESGNEWVELYNNGSSSLDISGYKIDDIEGGSSPFTIPQGTTIGPHNYLYFSFTSRLNNDGDTARLLNSSGQVLEEHAYQDSQKGVSFAKDSNSSWQETTTLTPGAANIITKPVSAEGSTQTTSSKKTASTKTSPSPAVAGAKDSTTQKKSSSGGITEDSSDYVLPETATTTAQIQEATSEAEVATLGGRGNLLGPLFLGGAGVILLAGAVIRHLKLRRK